MTFLLGRARAQGPALLAATVTAMTLATLAPRDAEAFCRTTTTPVPASYSPTQGCFTDGLVLFWKNACVGYSVNSAATASTPLDVVTGVIDSAFGAWNKVTCSEGPVGIATSDVGPADCAEVRYNPNGPNQNIIVFRDDKWPYSDPNNTLGLTTVTFNADTGEIYDADMELNATGKNLSTSTLVPANGFDLLSVVTHEAGHFLGLAHATDSTATMFASYKPGTSSLRTLAADDIAGICDIYPSAAQRTVDPKVDATGVVAADACDPTPRHGFGSECAENPAPADSKTSGCSVGATHGASAGGRDGLKALLVAAMACGIGLVVRARVSRRRRSRG